MSSPKIDHIALQHDFAAHLRNPERHPAPEGIEDRRLAIYRRLFFNNIYGLLESNFPVLAEIYGVKNWRKICRDFYTEHKAITPLFPQIAQEFLSYLEHERQPQPHDPPFLHELAHYEWLELQVSLAESDVTQVTGKEHNTQEWRINPTLRIAQYHFPVQRISRSYQPQHPPEQPTVMAVYRRTNDDVHFSQLSGASALMLQILQENQHMHGPDWITAITQQFPSAQHDAIARHAQGQITEFAQSQLIFS